MRRGVSAFLLLSNRRRARQLAASLSRSKPTLLEEELDTTSRIVVATGAATERLAQIYGDPQQLLEIDRRRFEEVIAEIFHGFGYIVELTAQTRDGGRDIVALGTMDQIRTKYLIECKRPDPGNPVGVSFVRQLLGVVEDERATKGLLVATTRFTPDARALEQKNQWRLELKEFEQIMQWISLYLQLKSK